MPLFSPSMGPASPQTLQTLGTCDQPLTSQCVPCNCISPTASSLSRFIMIEWYMQLESPPSRFEDKNIATDSGLWTVNCISFSLLGRPAMSSSVQFDLSNSKTASSILELSVLGFNGQERDR